MTNLTKLDLNLYNNKITNEGFDILFEVFINLN